MSVTNKKLRLIITLGEGVFGETLADTITLEGFRMTAELQNPGDESMGMAQIKVFGLRQEIINKLTSIGTINKSVRLKNSISLDAGDDETGMQNVFQGTIFDAWGDYNSAPDVGFNIIAFAGLSAAVKPVNPTSYKGSTSVATIMQNFAAEAGLTFQDFGVQVQLASPYFQGTTLAKIRACARAAKIFHVVERGALIIAPLNTQRGSAIPDISPETGMVGYPTLSSKGMQLTLRFNINILLQGTINVKSSVPMACGKWCVTNLSHSLSCELPNGPWFTYLECYSVQQ